MSNPAHDLLLLLLNLTQQKSADRIRSTFIDAVSILFAPIRIRWLATEEDFVGESIAVATLRKEYGRIAVIPADRGGVAEALPLLRNSASMLAVILEKLETDRLLADEKLLLQEQVDARTAELSRANRNLKLEIEERMQVEEALLESERTLLQAQRITHIGSWVLRLATNEATCSEEMLRIWGFDLGEKTLPLEEFAVRIHPEDRKRVMAALENAQKGIARYDEVFRITHPEKGRRFINGSGEVVPGEDGRPVTMSGTCQDMTEFKLAEDVLRESEAKYRGLVENLPQRIFHKDANSVYVSCTANFAEDMGIAPDAIGGKTDFDFFPRELAEKYQTDDRRIMQSGRPEELEEIYTRDGEERIAQTVKTPLTDEAGNAVGILGIFLDITDRRKLEQQYQTLFHEMLDGFALHEIICDGQGTPVDYRFLTINPAFERLTGLQARDVQGKTVREVIPGIESHWIETYGRVALTGEPVFFENFAEGLNKHFEVKAFRPGPNLFACIFADITARKEAEEEKASLEEQLHRAQKMEAVGRLAGGVAHDFNNILTGIIGFAELIQATLGPGDPVHGDLEEIRKAANRAADLTAQLLAFSRKQIIHPRVIQPNDVLQNSQKMLRRIIGEDIDFAFKPSRGLWRIRADTGQLDQILVNLAVNARDAMPGGGRLTIETRNVTIEDAYSRAREGLESGEYVMLAVSDNGQGMDRETRAHIFEPFYSTKSKDQGTGLGLSTVYGIMEQNKGFIDVYSEQGVGSTFKIYFPAVMEEADPLVPPDTVSHAKGSETILLVEDEEMVRRLAKKILEKHGYSVIDKHNGGLAMMWAEKSEEPIDLLLTDVIMPGMNGRELLKRLQGKRPGLKALFMSGYTENVIAHHGVLDQGTEFIQKPFSVGSLTRKVRDVLDS